MLASRYAFHLLIYKCAPSEEDEKENRRRGIVGGGGGVFDEKHCMYFETKQTLISLRVPREYPLVLLVQAAGGNVGHWEMDC
jgi:hypothetical protein